MSSEPQHALSPAVTDLNALADRLDMYEQWVHGKATANDLRTAARILRAVAAAPGPLRGGLCEESDCEWCPWFRALADAVGEQ